MTRARKRCATCKREYELRSRYFYRWRDQRYGTWRWSRHCRKCTRAQIRRRYAAIMADPYTRERERERKREWAGARERENAARCRRYRERLKRERPDVYQQQIEDARIRNKLRHERAGGTLKPAEKWRRQYVYLDPTPLVALAANIELRERQGCEDATLLRALRRLRSGESQRVELGIADALAIRAGLMIQDLYPELAA